MNRVGRAITAGRQYLADQQREDGGFDGIASADPAFTNTRTHPTIFFTALIAQACHEICGSEAIKQAACTYLLAHKSAVWSWNYWQRDIDSTSFQQYPDDLDDTACAISAIIAHDPTQLSGTVLGHIGRQLVSSENAVGGPYQTWLVGATLLPTWHDIDVAVNANIAGLLNQAEVMPPGLEAYLQHALEHNELASSYYIGVMPTLYFMARSGTQGYSQALATRIGRELQQIESLTPLMAALLLSAACRTGFSARQLARLTDVILDAQTITGWPAEGLYIEPAIDGIPYTAGSAALTTAFVCEALSLYERLRVNHIVASKLARTKQNGGLALARRQGLTVAHPIIRKQYLQALRHIARRDKDGQISQSASHFAADATIAIQPDILQQFDAASINGWIAYTVYDDLLDGDANARQLGMANVALRQCVQHFRQGLLYDQTFDHIVHAVLNTVDEANSWEITHARRAVADGKIRIRQVPDYGNLIQLAQRSWGHVLATTGVLLAAGYAADGPEVYAWQLFFKHYLIARQLNDDAHDWLEDLSAGRMTVVVSLLLADWGLPTTIVLQGDIPALREQFWQTTILQICELIEKQLRLADAALNTCTFLNNMQRYQQLLHDLATATAASRNGRQEALDFMHSFEQTDRTTK